MSERVLPKGAFVSFGITLQGADGGFEISATRDNTKVWIKRVGGVACGEGGEFHAGDLLELIEKFYNKHF